VFWLNRRSEEPSPTQIKCYWEKARLPKVANTDVHLAAEDTGKKRLTLTPGVEESSLQSFFIESMSMGAMSSASIIRHCQPKTDLIGIDGLVQAYSTLNRAQNDAVEFITFAKDQMNDTDCANIATKTVLQSKSKTWEKCDTVG
jgi:hypothetical protein